VFSIVFVELFLPLDDPNVREGELHLGTAYDSGTGVLPQSKVIRNAGGGEGRICEPPKVHVVQPDVLAGVGPELVKPGPLRYCTDTS